MDVERTPNLHWNEGNEVKWLEVNSLCSTGSIW